MKTLVITTVSLFFILVLMALFGQSRPQIEKEVISGKATLSCLFSDGWRDIPRDKIINFDESTGYWQFTNGYAKTCEIDYN